LERIEIPTTITEINDHAFFDCNGLKVAKLCEGLQKIGESAFARCNSLEIIEIPSTVTVIDDEAFVCCEGLKKVKLAEGLQEIGYAAFYECTLLEIIRIPSTVTVIDDEAFVCCEGLKEVKLREGLKTIGKSAFWCCTSLERINILSTLEAIGRDAFLNCSSLLQRDVCLDTFTRALCNTSSINATYSSNHNLTSLGLSNDRERMFTPLLELNGIEDKGQVAAVKILRYHDHLDMKPFLEWDSKCLPLFVTWFSRASSYLGNDDEANDTVGTKKLDAIYQFLRGLPSELEGL